jgi:crotonobetainyl-CoA:carnitine CoA-transferase CaiB-like acyl-CoA transferase
MMQEHFFKDLVVVELASVLAGPSVGRFFAECGARVIKIENSRTRGDVTRTWFNSLENKDGISAYYASVNQGKEVVMLDLSLSADLQKLEEYLSLADVVISNYKKESAEKWMLNPDQVRKRFPQVIFGFLEAFGDDDNRVAYDIVLQAEAGYLSMCGTADNPARLPVAMIDLLAGHQLKEGILMGLLHKERTGKGVCVRVNLLDSAVGALINQAGNYLMTGMIPQGQGTLHPNIAPYGEWFTCKDGNRIILAIGSQEQFHKLLNCLNLNDLKKDPRFINNSDRVKNRIVLADQFRPIFLKEDRAYWNKLLNQQQIPCGSILTVKEVMDGAGKKLIREVHIEGTLTQAVSSVNFHLEA